jgi:release factor glutamine methyltransferase
VVDSIGLIVSEAAASLAKAGCDEPRRRARQLIAGALDLSAAELLMRGEHQLDGSQVQQLRNFITRMAAGEPLSRILKRREFWGLDFELSPDTLDPRPDSETIIEAVLARVDRSDPLRVLDLGTGSGCLLLALLSELPIATGIGVDISEGAVATARRNAESLGLNGRSGFFVGDWGYAIAQRFDIVVANPPYIVTSALRDLPQEVRLYDPPRALDGGDRGLAAYQHIIALLPILLTPSGLFAAEIGSGQAVDVVALLRGNALACDAVERDLGGIERCIVARKTASQH